MAAVAKPAAPAVIPGMSEDRMSIIDPGQYMNNYVTNIFKQIGILRIPSKINPPTFNLNKILIEDSNSNTKLYIQIPFFGQFTRISTSRNNNGSWFDSFLSCTSSVYRTVELKERLSFIEAFRTWCINNSKSVEGKGQSRILINQLPKLLGGIYTAEEYVADISNREKEINKLTGFIVAWYFGVNIIYIDLEDKGPVLDTLLPYQSPECKTIFMAYSVDSGGVAHYEPVGILGLTSENKYDEAKSTFIFDWTDTRICDLKGRPTTWTHPVCLPAAPNAGPKAAPNAGPKAVPNANSKSKVNTPEYYEYQDNTASCGRHALNHLLHRKKFVKEGGRMLDSLTMDPKLTKTDEVNLPRICELYQAELLKLNPNASSNLCQESENYDINVLTAALNIVGFNVELLNIINPPKEVSANTYGFLINLGGGHWVSTTREGTGYMYYNSIASKDNRKAISYPTLYSDILEKKTKIGDIKGLYKVTNTGVFINPIIKLTESIAQTKTEAVAGNSFGETKIQAKFIINGLKLTDKSKAFLLKYIVNNSQSVSELKTFIPFLSRITDADIETIEEDVRKLTTNVSSSAFTQLQTAILVRETAIPSNRITLKTNATEGKPAIEVVVGIGDKVKIKNRFIGQSSKCLGKSKYGTIGTIVGIDKTDTKGLVVSVNCNGIDPTETTGAWYIIDELEPVLDEPTVAAAVGGRRRRKTRRRQNKKKRVTQKRKYNR